MKFYVCEHCGNIIEYHVNKGVPVMCCGQKMTLLEPGTTDASREKHVPVIEQNGNKVLVKIGEAELILAEGEEVVAAYEYCNLHGLWKK